MQSVVVDVGSRNTRIGFSGEEAPRTSLRSCVGGPQVRRLRPTFLQHRLDVVTGDAAYEDSGLLELAHPMRAGRIADYDAYEKLLFGALLDEVRIAPNTNPFLFLESADQTRAEREKLCEILFESFDMPMVGLLTNTAATLYASGRTSGVALDSGASRTCVAAVLEGYTLSHTIRLSTLAGDALTEELFAALRHDGYPLSTARDRDVVEAAKESLCRVSADIAHETDASNETDAYVTPDPEDGFVLPDQQRLFLLQHAYQVPEALFNVRYLHHSTPALTAETATSSAGWFPPTSTAYVRSNPTCGNLLEGWVDLIRDAAAAAPKYLENTLYENVVLGGGNTLFHGTEQRVQRGIAAIVPRSVLAACVAFPERGAAAWIGASIWGCSSVFADACLTKAAYHEQGRSVVHIHAQ